MLEYLDEGSVLAEFIIATADLSLAHLMLDEVLKYGEKTEELKKKYEVWDQAAKEQVNLTGRSDLQGLQPIGQV
ncbi:hypothetical protein Btru_028154 [Bulinus truncatus]|nr:hypothetical protein Btru_028154 [Bulinus truncatus]